MSSPDKSNIVEFFKGQSVLITGVTGFLGKTLFWILLNHCKDIKSVYLLIRGKKGKSPQERLDEDVLSLEIFQTIFQRSPHLRDIIHAVDGDISVPNLGMDENVRKNIQKDITVVLHCAATVKFTENLKLALELNTLGGKRMLDFSKGCPNLVSHVHVSTAYVNCIHKSGDVEIREKIYPINVEPNAFIEKINSMTYEQADQQTAKLIDPYPNTYTFTKALGEHCLLNEREDIPICIVRPSIVGCAYNFPIRGWVDSMGGASGLLLSLGIGALHSMKGRSSNVADFIPVDFVAMTIMAAAWKTAEQYGYYPSNSKNAEKRKSIPSLPIYHCASSTRNPTLWSWMASIIGGYFRRHPAKRTVGIPFGFYIPNPYIHYLSHLAFHVLPAMIVDGKRTLERKPRKMVKAIKQLHIAISAICFFTDYQWFFSTDNVDKLIESMNEKDRELFPIDIRVLDWEHYFVVYAEGIRTFLLKEKVDEVDIASRIRSRL